MRNKLITIILLNISVLLITPPVLANDTEPSMPGRTEGTGTYFEITDSEYLNISLQSSEEITIFLESVPKIISLHIEASSVVSSTVLTIGNLEPNTTYYRFEDSYKNEVVFTSDNEGKHTWTQDLSAPHHIWFQPEDDGTVFLPEDCSNYGIWDEINSTCTLTQDLTESVEITADNITLDCKGYSITGDGTGYGAYLNRKTSVTIKNCIVTNFSYGIYLYHYSNNNGITNNSINSNQQGIHLEFSSLNTISNNNINLNQQGIVLSWATGDNNITENTFQSNAEYGLYMTRSWLSGCHSEGNKIWRNKFYDKGISQCGKNYYSIDAGNYYASSVPIGQVPWAIDYGPTPNLDVDVDQTKPTSFEWNVGASYSSIKEATYNTNVSRVIRIVKGTGPYLERVQILRNYITLDCQNETLDGNNTGNGVYVDKATGVTIKDCAIRNFNYGIYISSDYTIITNNNINSNKHGIHLEFSHWNTISNNVINLNQQGIVLSWATSDNNITENTFQSNAEYGLYMTRSWLSGCHSEGNRIYHNNFIDNKSQVYACGSNFFDNGYPLDFDPLAHGGNYWSDYTGADLYSGPNQDQPDFDGIGDTPHVFTGGQDQYPFMEESGWTVPPNQPPVFLNLNQYKSDGVTTINEGQTTTESTMVFKAIVSDPDDDQAKLQVEIKEYTQGFNEQDIMESDFVNSGEIAQIARYGLISQIYHWRARVVDSKKAPSAWREFGTAGNVDFEVKLVPLYTQVRSPYPSDDETKIWAELDYAKGVTGNYSCGSKIRDCGCAITSEVMIMRFYNITAAVDGKNVDPGTFNEWSIVNNGYWFDGNVKWEKIMDYSKNQFGIPRLVYSGPVNSEDTNILNSQLNNLQPTILNTKVLNRQGKLVDHFIVADGKLSTAYTVKDPTYYLTKNLNQPRSSYIYDYDNHFAGLRLFSPVAVLPDSISAHFTSPGELLFTDPLGRRLGKDPINNIEYNEIPGGVYYQESIGNPESDIVPEASKNIWIPEPRTGQYDIKIIGTEIGGYTLSILVYDQTGNSKDITQTGNILPDITQEFELNYSTTTAEQTELQRIVNIDIKPGSDPNSINCQNPKEVIPVAILTTPIFDTATIDADTVRFGPNNAQEIHKDKNNKAKRHIEDVDKDGDLDLVLHFKFADTGIQCGDTSATLTGKTTNDADIIGSDSIRTVQNGKQSILTRLLAAVYDALSAISNKIL